MPQPAVALLGIDTYSLRALRWQSLQLLDYAASLGATTIQLSLNDFESLDPAHLASVKQKAAAQNLTLDSSIGCICRTTRGWNPQNGDPVAYLTKGLRLAHSLGARAVRCFMGSNPDRSGKLPLAAHLEETLKTFRAVRSLALDLQVKIAIENHGDLTARETRLLIEEAGSNYVGVCLDTGNPMWLLEDPMLTVEVLAPHIVSTHLRDSVLYEHPRGAAFQWVASGDGCVGLEAVIRKLRTVAPQAPLQLEVITGRPPQLLPYLDESYWRSYRALPAPDFARFVALSQRGRPFEGSMIIADGLPAKPPEYDAALRAQQKFDLERSFQWTRSLLA